MRGGFGGGDEAVSLIPNPGGELGIYIIEIEFTT